jgi:GalNAc-alpha-(1->4)-GalNAc-alpha-(1->3)-diNAcBac-PP-undecaprenol alpha-1,4-N-acetyl-D-galactosaminyltransferase
MKMVFVTSSLGTGGAERVTSILAAFFSKTNDVTVIVTSATSFDEFYSVGNSKVVYLSPERKISPFSKIFKLKKLIKRITPNVIVGFPDPCSFYASIVSKWLHIPCVCSERNAPMFEPSKRLMRMLRIASYYMADRVVFQTEDARSYFSKIIQKKGILIPNPIQEAHICPRKPENYILSIGRLVPQKNFSCVIRAFSIFVKSHQEYSLLICGEGPLRKQLLEEAKTLGVEDRIKMPGFSKDLSDVYSHAKIFVLASDYEGMPNALIEAVIAGVPCISTDCPVGGSREILSENPYDFLVDPGDYKTIASCFEKILSSYDTYEKKCVDYGLFIKDQLSTEAIAKRWMDIFAQISREKK